MQMNSVRINPTQFVDLFEHQSSYELDANRTYIFEEFGTESIESFREIPKDNFAPLRVASQILYQYLEIVEKQLVLIHSDGLIWIDTFPNEGIFKLRSTHKIRFKVKPLPVICHIQLLFDRVSNSQTQTVHIKPKQMISLLGTTEKEREDVLYKKDVPNNLRNILERVANKTNCRISLISEGIVKYGLGPEDDMVSLCSKQGWQIKITKRPPLALTDLVLMIAQHIAQIQLRN